MAALQTGTAGFSFRPLEHPPFAAAGKLLAHELLHAGAEILQDLLHVCGGAEFQQLLVTLTQPGFTYTLVAGVFQLAALSQLMALLLWTA